MSTNERRTHKRERVIFGAKASGTGKISSVDCVVRNFSEAGACIEFKNTPVLPDDIALTIARKSLSYKARVIWWRDNTAGVAFQAASPSLVPDQDFEEQLRRSERKARELRSRVRQLTGGA